ncbi:LysR family transcriptional regulator [Aliidiomarina sedimenti]|uniref:LysR family transcriptional regulator n=1 Tax=Aliidiomarina sedimenti TaxID=1933879 RepID=A0ABY0BXU8_9GAMM|nr:LysR family transcriptional regulator [Aliidiomarina sedimenti]RUO29251.1 LysR family transcriptional regulator [Aliidiomarina sedimenti]
MNRLQAMQTFASVVSEGSFTQAADRLNISPQLVSKYVSQLETHLGVRLLNRTTRRIHLTEAGLQYYQRAQQVLNDIEDMECQLSDLQSEARGTLRISAPVSFAIRHLAPVVANFQQANPALSVDLQLNDRKVDIIEEGFDIALRIGRLKSSSLIAKRIAPIHLLYCASPAYLAEHGEPASIESLTDHRFLRYTYSDDSQVQNPAGSPAEEHYPLVSNNGDVLTAAAIAGAGIVLQPSFIASEAIKLGQLKVILAEQAPSPIALYAVYAHRQLVASKVRHFIDFIDGYFGDPPYWDALDANPDND